jgi:hypothetical protein
MPASKHNIRLDDALWEGIERRAREIGDRGVPSDLRPWMRFSMTDIFRRELNRVLDETTEQTMTRYGLTAPLEAAR